MSFLGNGITESLKKRYKKNSISTINTNLKRLFRECFDSGTFDVELLKSRCKDIEKYIESLKKVSVQKSMIHNIRSMIGEGYGYDEMVKVYNKKCNDVTLYAQPSDKLKEVHIPCEEMATKMMSFSFKNRGSGVKLVVSSLYRYLPPLRGQDFYNTVFAETPDNVRYDDHFNIIKKNFIDVRKWILVVGDYKTMKKYGIRKFKLNSALSKVLDTWRKSGLSDGENLLTNRFKKRFTQPAFTKLLWRIYGSNFGVDMIRKVYMSEMVGYLEGLENREETIEWRKKLAYMVGHSLCAQEFNYNSFRKIKDLKVSSRKYMENLYKTLRETYIAP